MSTATVEQIGPKESSKAANVWSLRLAELEVIYPAPVYGVSELLDEMRGE